MELKSAKPSRCYHLGMWNVKRKVDGIDQNSPVFVMVTIKALDKNKKVSAIFVDISKVLDTLNHVRLNAYGSSFGQIKFIQSYL